MQREPVELRVGGQTYRVVASADEPELRRLADLVDERLREHATNGRAPGAQSLLLVALSLVHELDEERTRRRHVEQRAREMLEAVLVRVDAALAADESQRQAPVREV